MKIRAHGFNQRPRFEQVVGYLERKEPLPLDQPDRKATSFVTSHFYLDDFAQSSKGPNPQDAAEYVRLNVLPRPGQPQPCCLPPGLHPGSGAHRRPPFLPSGWAGLAPGNVPRSEASRHCEVHLGRAPGALVTHKAAVQGVIDVVGLGHVHHEVGGRAEPVPAGEEELSAGRQVVGARYPLLQDHGSRSMFVRSRSKENPRREDHHGRRRRA